MSAVVDAFAGARGWEALSGLDALGIELDASACATSRAAGLRTLQADVAALDPLDFAPCEGWIGSPPCPTFSSAGRGSGRSLEDVIRGAIADLAEGRDTRAERRAEAYAVLEPDTARFDVLPSPRRRRKREQRAVSPVDRARIARREAKRELARREAATSLLVVEPLRWALALRPRWIALEQVPPVLPLWEAMAVVLRDHGYSVWCGILSAERYGVPQTRQRAILIASLDRVVSMPPPTHQRYIPPRKRAAEATADALFAVPEPERIVAPEDRHLLPWVSMAEALQWGMTARPSVSVLAKPGGTGGHRPLEGGGGARETLHRAREDGEWIEGPSPSPSPSVTAGGTGSGGGVEVFASREARERAANAVRFVNSRENATTRAADEPAPTITAGHDHQERRWVLRSGQSVAGEGRAERSTVDPSLTVISRFDFCEWVPEGQARNSGPGAEREPRPIDAPSYTIRAAGSGSHPSGVEWVGERPSTTVNCDPRIAEPGRHEPGDSGSQYGPETVRVSIEEAAALQSFPADWPWWAAGTKTAAFRCVGNAVPPLLALHVLLAVGGPELAAMLRERLAALYLTSEAA